MSELATISPASLDKSFHEYERPIRVRNAKVCCVIAGIFMPAGAALDYFVYGREVMMAFLPNRLICACLLGLLWLIFDRWPETRLYRILGIFVALLPVLSISLMIYTTPDGAVSPYYAGLNLVNLGTAILLRWTAMDSVLIFLATLVAYLMASLLHGPVTHTGIFFNNIYFLLVTGVFIVAGAWHYNTLRQSEFQLRHRLDNNRLALEESNKKLRELDEIKSRFFANISHELRTPLTLLVAPLESLLHRSGSLFGPEERELLDTMHSNAMRLLKLINDLLDLVRLEAGRVQLNTQRVVVEDLVMGLANSVKGVAMDKRIHLQSTVEPELGCIMADPEKLERICLNLLFNAMKFTAAGGLVELRSYRDDHQLVLEVQDSGMGIDPDHLPHIFDRFWQADTSSQRKFQGMGIGLALVRELAEAQGGSVHATSEVGKGTLMQVRIPYEPASDKLPAEPEPEIVSSNGKHPHLHEPEPEPDWIADLYRRAELFPSITSLQATLRPIETQVSLSKKPKLLIADDEPDMLRFLKTQLSIPFEVLEAVDGQQALDKANQFLPDIILLDMMMPEKDGLQVCRELRDRLSTQAIPVVLLTARADERTKIDCLKAGANDFLSKPFSLTEVTVRLKNLVDSSHFQKELIVQKQKLEAALEQVRETETLLVRNEKLASLGRMSAGLIHEINNPLNYARQGLYVLKETSELLPEDARDDFLETLQDVDNGVNRVARIISDLRGFTRVTNETAQVFILKPVVETTLRFFSHEWKGGIQVETDIPETLEIRGDSNHLVQVLINLIQNSIDAMRNKSYAEGEGPRIEIRAGREFNGSSFVRVRDNGPGVPDEIKARVFDPFFTTKDVGAGMGLGLAICHRILSEHGGRIDVQSEAGVFSEFVMEFPAVSTIFPSFEAQ